MAGSCVSGFLGLCAETWVYLDQVGVLLGLAMPVISIVITVIAWINKESIRNWFTRNRFPEIGGQVGEEQHWDGIIFTVSHVTVPKWVMQTLKPHVVGFIASEKSKNIALELEKQARSMGIDVIGTLICNPVDDPSATRAPVNTLLKAMRTAGNERLAVDLTGGKVPMSIGAFMAAEEEMADSLYISVHYDKNLKKPDMRHAVICRVSFPLENA